MNLLLLLSALLSALTGVSGVRGPQAARAVAERVEGVRVAARRAVAATARPVQAPSSLVEVAAFGMSAAVPMVRAIPAWTTRRRE